MYKAVHVYEKWPILQGNTKKSPTFTRTCQTDQMNEIAAGKTRTHNNRPITRLHNYPFYRGRVPWLGHFGAFFPPHVPFPCGDNCPRYTHTHPHTDHQVGHDRRRNKRAASGRTLHYRRLVVPLTDSIFPPFDDVQRKWSNLWAHFFRGIITNYEQCWNLWWNKVEEIKKNL